MKKIFLSLVAASLMAVSLIPFGGIIAQEDSGFMPTADPTFGKGLNNVGMVNKPITDVLDTLANYIIGIFLIVAVFYTLWAAYLFMTSDGDAEKVGAARSKIMYAGIGVVVALLAKGIISLVLNAVSPSGG